MPLFFILTQIGKVTQIQNSQCEHITLFIVKKKFREINIFTVNYKSIQVTPFLIKNVTFTKFLSQVYLDSVNLKKKKQEKKVENDFT